MTQPTNRRKPEWLRASINTTPESRQVISMLRKLSLHTVCEEAHCPNRGECFHKRTATFMILGNHCTRNCTFCTVKKQIPSAVDANEPAHVASAVKQLGLKHVVITSVTRDDLPDGGASHFAAVIRAIRAEYENNAPIIEVLIPDFQGSKEALFQVIEAQPQIINHNIETIKSLYPRVRPMAIYERSLELLERVKQAAPKIYTKSGIMVGLGETHQQVLDTLQDLKQAGCDIVTIGQYLAPSKEHHPVVEYVTPEEFKEYEKEAYAMGFLSVASAPLVRSSYMAADAFAHMRKETP